MVVQVKVNIPAGDRFSTPMHLDCIHAMSEAEAIRDALHALKLDGFSADQVTLKVLPSMNP